MTQSLFCLIKNLCFILKLQWAAGAKRQFSWISKIKSTALTRKKLDDITLEEFLHTCKISIALKVMIPLSLSENVITLCAAAVVTFHIQERAATFRCLFLQRNNFLSSLRSAHRSYLEVEQHSLWSQIPLNLNPPCSGGGCWTSPCACVQ